MVRFFLESVPAQKRRNSPKAQAGASVSVTTMLGAAETWLLDSFIENL